MGSTLSGIKATLDFAECEADFIEQGHIDAGFGVVGRTLDEGLQILRYVDDALLCSTTFCTSCLAEAGGVLYQAPLVFEIEEVGQTVRFLDLQVEVVGQQLQV